MATRVLIPNMASDMKERIRREAYLTSEIMIRMDLLRATGQLDEGKYTYMQKVQLFRYTYDVRNCW